MTLHFNEDEKSARFAVRFSGERILFETYKLNPKERGELKTAFTAVYERCWDAGYVAGQQAERDHKP